MFELPAVDGEEPSSDASTDAEPGRTSPPENEGPALRPGDTVGSYTLLGLLGEGSAGSVFRATHRQLGHTCALKILRPHFRGSSTMMKRFAREAAALGELRHPNVVRILDAGQTLDDGAAYIAMELLDGPTLQAEVKARMLAPQRAIRIAVDLARGLSAIHERQIIHRDLKPANVILVKSPDGEAAKITDLGIARFSNVDETRLTRPGGRLGTLAYMAPEQLEDASSATIAADLYSLGATICFMITGSPPRAGTTLPTSGGLGPIAAALLSPEPADRPASAELVAESLSKLGPDPDATRLLVAPNGGSLVRRPSRALATLALGAIALGFGILGVELRSRLGPEPRTAVEEVRELGSLPAVRAQARAPMVAADASLEPTVTPVRDAGPSGRTSLTRGSPEAGARTHRPDAEAPGASADLDARFSSFKAALEASRGRIEARSLTQLEDRYLELRTEQVDGTASEGSLSRRLGELERELAGAR